MKIFLDCIPCFVRQGLDSARLVSDDEQVHEQVLREVLRLTANLDMGVSPPAIGQKIHRLIREILGQDDPYKDIKDRFNKLALEMYPELEERVRNSEDPFETAVRLAIAGNIIDFGVATSLKESDIHKTIEQSLSDDLDAGDIEEFRAAVANAKKILYLADNAGEIVFDRLLIEQLPCEKMAVVVKASPVINDATMEDADFAGLDDIVEVIDNGSDGPGTILKTCSQSFLNRFEDADLIISKGQGNYETLSDIDKNIFFVLKVKCSVIAEELGCEVGKMILLKTKIFEGETKNAKR